MASVSFDLHQIQQLKSCAVRGRPYSERISIPLAFQLMDNSDSYFDCFSVLDELDYLEGIRSVFLTKPEKQFTESPLYPFWHKHFFSARHLVKNLGIRWNLDGKKQKDLTAMINDVAENYGDDCNNWPGHIAHRLVIQGFKERVESIKFGLTGDWIIYAKYSGQNYYLSLATHKEGTKENVNTLLLKLKNGCYADFPFLFA